MRLAGKALWLSAALCAASWTGSPSADEGMWTYNQVPLAILKERYGFEPTQAWLDHLRLSSANMHASASFVSADGLLLTNHHVAMGSVQRLSTPEHNYIRDGFLAKTLEEEIPIPGLTVRVLVSFDDITAQIEAAAKGAASPSQAHERRDAAQAAIEAACEKETGFKGRVVVLYGGAKYMIHRYREYDDVRLVFAPELQAAAFGGDPDNFTFPRHDLDMSLMRAYENGKPAKVEHFLKVNPRGAAEGDLVFVSGNPGSTDRLLTVSVLDFKREVEYPFALASMRGLRSRLAAYSERGTEQARRARTHLYFLDNALKSQTGEFAGLNDAALMKVKSGRERDLRAALRKDPALAPLEAAWIDIEKAVAWQRAHARELEHMLSGDSRGLASASLWMSRYADEIAKPDAQRLSGYHEAELADLLRSLQSPSPVYKDLEEVTLAYRFETLLSGLGPEDPFVKASLQGKSPAEAAKALVEGTRIVDAAYRAELLKKGGRALRKCKDPMIEYARRVDPFLREAQKAYRENVEAVYEQALPQIARAGFSVYGAGSYPDATGTLRLAFGKVAGHPFATTLVPPFTTFYGLYDRAYSFGAKGEYALYPAAEKARSSLDLSTPLNTICTADITGGNSGSPLVDREGRLVGLVFDGNATSHPNTFVYDETTARCVSVDIRGILEALRKMYSAGYLADEMVQGRR